MTDPKGVTEPLSVGAQAVDLNLPRICIYCGKHFTLPGLLNCGPCMQGVRMGHDGGEVVVLYSSRLRPSIWRRVWAWFLDPS